MKRTTLNALLTVAAILAPAASAMNYTSHPGNLPTLPVPTIQLFPNTSSCSSDSNTIAVGYQAYAHGFQILCADAGEIGFWTHPQGGTLVGSASLSIGRFLCPSGMALAGLLFEEVGIALPVCGELIPDFKTGTVRHGPLFSTNNVEVAKEDKNGVPSDPSIVSCGAGGFIQTLVGSRDASNQVTGFGGFCNTIQTVRIVENSNVDLAARTVGQTATLDHNANQQFRVDIFNLGVAAIPASAVSFDVRFDGTQRDVRPVGPTVCNLIQSHTEAGLVTVGRRCSLPGSVLAGKGGVAHLDFLIEQSPSAVLNGPLLALPKPVVTVKANVDEQVDGADGNATNDFAAFPVLLQ